MHEELLATRDFCWIKGSTGRPEWLLSSESEASGAFGGFVRRVADRRLSAPSVSRRRPPGYAPCQTQLPDTETTIETEDNAEHDTTRQAAAVQGRGGNKFLSAVENTALAGDECSRNGNIVHKLETLFPGMDDPVLTPRTGNARIEELEEELEAERAMRTKIGWRGDEPNGSVIRLTLITAMSHVIDNRMLPLTEKSEDNREWQEEDGAPCLLKTYRVEKCIHPSYSRYFTRSVERSDSGPEGVLSTPLSTLGGILLAVLAGSPSGPRKAAERSQRHAEACRSLSVRQPPSSERLNYNIPRLQTGSPLLGSAPRVALGLITSERQTELRLMTKNVNEEHQQQNNKEYQLASTGNRSSTPATLLTSDLRAVSRAGPLQAEKQRADLTRELDELTDRLEEAGGVTASQVGQSRALWK
ncbi:hypothetical protein CCH79_00003398 [Gambusia affinis]|uniref:Uncharacterized protein n=1 Tax=Gambusia affinis TaxID=33528 RepID=A0A315VR41_GAMAF|nr:hypothetical protein CCH79_00003398 [Gambusia affinis]